MAVIGITILGSTGSIGRNTLDVLSEHLEQYNVVALTANRNVDVMLQQCLQFKPQFAVMQDTDAADQLQAKLREMNCQVAVLSGEKGLQYVASLPQIEVVMAAIVGAPGLNSTLAAARAGKRILLANKEALVMSGALMMNTVQAYDAELIPVDSEHNAIMQSLPTHYRCGDIPQGVCKLHLTASGGPFRDLSLDKLADVTPIQAIAHPNWNMGQKISVDSATMMNKALEVIEAHWLFNMPADKIEVILHPQSMIHSMVSYEDGSVVAELGNPDMRTPIASAVAWPDRIATSVKPLDLIEIGRLDFQAIDIKRYPCLVLAYQALNKGGTASAILNAANEVAVSAFLRQKIRFTDIYTVVADTLHQLDSHPADTLAHILADDKAARDCAECQIATIQEVTSITN